MGDQRPMESRKCGDNVHSTVGMKFGKPVITQTLGGQEPMVCLDAAALTARIGRISQPEKPVVAAPIYESMANRLQPGEAKWRRALRPRVS